jgi:hypothetical protein
LLWGLWPCGVYIFREHVSAGVYSQCVPGFSIFSPGILDGTAGGIAGVLYWWIWRGPTLRAPA